MVVGERIRIGSGGEQSRTGEEEVGRRRGGGGEEDN